MQNLFSGKCNKCSQSYYAIKYVTQTAMYFPPIYKDGININPDRNITTTVCECLNCGNIFSYRTCGGELIDD